MDNNSSKKDYYFVAKYKLEHVVLLCNGACCEENYILKHTHTHTNTHTHTHTL